MLKRILAGCTWFGRVTSGRRYAKLLAAIASVGGVFALLDRQWLDAFVLGVAALSDLAQIKSKTIIIRRPNSRTEIELESLFDLVKKARRNG